MNSITQQRIVELCKEKGVKFTRANADLELGNGYIRKAGKDFNPSASVLLKIANYFGVSIDYLLGITDIKSPAHEVLNDQDIVSFQRAREKMTPQDRDKAMQMLKLGFDYAFKEDEEDDEN